MSVTFSKLEKSVRAMTDAGDGAVKLLSVLSEKIRETAGDKEASEALATEIDAKKAVWAEAVLANTPAEPPEPPVPPV